MTVDVESKALVRERPLRPVVADRESWPWVDTGSWIVAELNRGPFQVVATYPAELRESSFIPSGRSSPLGDTCR